jgi:hypothetical protein
VKYQPPYGPPGAIPADASYVNGDPSIGRQGSVPPASAFEYPQREIVNLITNSQQMPTDQDLNQMTRAVRDGKLIYCLDSGPLNTLEIAALLPPILNYTQGLTLHVLVGHTVTGPTTISIGNLNPTSVKRRDGSELQQNDMVAGQIATLACDGTFFQLLNMGADGGLPGGTTTLQKVDIPYVHDTGAVDPATVPPTTANPNPPQPTFTNHVVGLYSPALPDINEGRTVEVKLNQTIYGPTDFAPNNFPVHPVAHPDGTPIRAGDGDVNWIWLLVYDGVQWQLLDVFNVGPGLGPTPPKAYKGKSLQFKPIGATTWPGPYNGQQGLYRYPSLNSNRSVFSISFFVKWAQNTPTRVYNSSDWMFSAGDEGGSWWGCTMNWLGVLLCANVAGGGQGANIFELFWANSGGQVAGVGTYESYTGTSVGYYQGGILGDTKWHHILVNADGAHMTAFVDGTMVSQGNVSGPSPWNSTQVQCIGMMWSCSGGPLGSGAGFYTGTTARMAEIIAVDGQCLDWTHFAQAQNGIVVPVDYTVLQKLPFGPNGFWLSLQNAVDCTATGLGKDFSGNNNNFTPTNFDLTHVMDDYPGIQQA